MKKFFTVLQKIGKALMLPIAVLPVAGIFMRLGQADLLNNAFIAGCGSILFDNLPMLFAIGVAVGLSFDGSGAAGLSGLVSYLIFSNGLFILDESLNMGVLAGIVTGITAALFYNRFHDIKLPDVLSFFGGKRFVPIVSGVVSILLALLFSTFWGTIQDALNAFGEFLIDSGVFGTFVYGVGNALLLPFGLHHILNNLFWFIFGSFTDSTGAVVTGDLYRFFAGDPAAGTFMAGFYPIFMFGIPGAALAMYRCAKKENKKLVGGLFLSTALTLVVTGIGEPFYFMFLFAAPGLYLIHAVLQGTSLAIAGVLGIKHGFTFSAGLIDYVLSFGIATKPLLLLVMGVIYFFLYYFIFTFAIKRFDLKTPGREDIAEGNLIQTKLSDEEYTKLMIQYLGGGENLKTVEACITRLRLVVNDTDLVDKDKLKSLGASGVMQVGNNVQVVIGGKAEKVASDIRRELKRP